MRLTAEVLSLARRRGLPVPRHELVVELADGEVAAVQERLPGMPTGEVTARTIDAMVAMNERFADLLMDRSDVPRPELCLRHSGPERPYHEVLARHSKRSRSMLQRIREVGANEPHEMPGADLVHTDYARGNVLWDEDGQITGVVDWNQGVACGDRHFALVGLRSDLQWSALYPDGGGVDRAAIGRLDEILELRIDPHLLKMYWGHWSLVKVYWAIVDNSPEAFDLFLDLGEARLH